MKVAIAHPLLWRGGSEAAVVWSIEAMKHDHDVSVVTCGRVDIPALNKFYGTRLAQGDFHVRRHPLSFLLGSTTRIAALRGALHDRFCRAIASQFDLMISGYNIVDFGVPGIHLIVDFSWDEKVRRASDPSPSGVAGLVYRDNPLRKCYLACARMLQRASGRDPFARDNLFLANSRWTADMMRQRHGVEARVLYPPVADDFAQAPFGARENGFVYIGRISPEKRVEDVIAILSKVRSLGHDVHLHIAGRIGTDPYGRRVRRLCLEHRGWVFAEGQCSGEKKKELLAAHRFGINACPREGFGISVAELVKAGSIVFVPREGGQAEIVAHPMLTFDGLEDAVRKIGTVLCQQELQQELSRHLAKRGMAFSTVNFMDGMRQAVSLFLKEHGTLGHAVK